MMALDMPPPLTPPDCDLRDFHRMMIDIPRLRASAFDAIPDDAAWRAGLNLWLSAFHSIPAASLDDDEATLCKAASLGRDLKTWRKVRAAAMRGWVLCSDGRWYHETVAEIVLEAWLGKLSQRLSSGAGNARRYNTVFDAEPVKAAIGIAAALLATINPASKAIPKASRQAPDGSANTSRQDYKTVPSGSQETVEGKETGQEIGKNPIPHPTPKPERKNLTSFVVGRAGKKMGGVTLQDPQERIARFQKTIADAIGKNGWNVVAAAADPSDPEYERALALCKSTAEGLGKGWPQLWPKPQRASA